MSAKTTDHVVVFYGFSTVVLKSFIILLSVSASENVERQIFYMIKCSKLITAQNCYEKFLSARLAFDKFISIIFIFQAVSIKTSLS